MMHRVIFSPFCDMLSARRRFKNGSSENRILYRGAAQGKGLDAEGVGRTARRDGQGGIPLGDGQGDAFLGFDVSYVAVFAALAGVLLLAAALFLAFRGRPKKALLMATLVLLFSFCLLEARDYVFVKYYRLPPQFNLQVVWGENGIRYDKLFYDVYRYHVDTADETYVIAANQKNEMINSKLN